MLTATSGDYCVVAIWSNLELFLAIITANLALSRSVYLYFFKKSSDQHRSTAAPYEPSDGQRSAGTRKGSDQRRKRSIFDVTLGSTLGTQLPGLEAEDHFVSECRRGSSTKSAADSEYPLEPQIRKKTEFYVHEEAEESSSSNDDGEHQKARDSRSFCV